MDCIVYGVVKSRTRLRGFFNFSVSMVWDMQLMVVSILMNNVLVLNSHKMKSLG